MEDALDVEGQHLLEGGLVEVGQGGAPGGAGVVDQDVEVVDPGGHLLGQQAAVGLGGQVGRDADAGALGRQLGGHLGAGLGLARGDGHDGPGLDEAFGDHPADAPGAAGDQGGLAGDGEEVGSAHAPIVAWSLMGRPMRWRCAGRQRRRRGVTRPPPRRSGCGACRSTRRRRPRRRRSSSRGGG